MNLKGLRCAALFSKREIKMDFFRLTADIDLDAIAFNIQQIRERIEPKTQLLAIVKADGYGHGALECAKVCLYNGANQLAVATCDEGVQLRDNSIRVPVLILGNTVNAQLEAIIKNRLTQTVYSYDMAKALSETGERVGKKALVHLKIDTGMGRIGFSPDESSFEEIEKIFALPYIEVTGIFTHFSTADEADKSFTIEQYKKFRYMTDGLEARGHKGLIRHCANSGAILDMPEYQLDMVRAGVIIYGLYPSDEVTKSIELHPAMSVRTQVSFVKKVPAGTSIGYGRKYITDKPEVIATLPIGYADGYPRVLSNKGRVIVNGHYAPIRGDVCMDQMMIDVTDIPGVEMGTPVTVMGKADGLEISAEEIAKLSGTINYEIVCNYSKRVPRAYYKNGELEFTVKSI